MNRNSILSAAIALATACICSGPAAANAPVAKIPVECVDPFIGTGPQGKTFPGAATPQGMVQLSPDTITGGDNGSGYRYHDTTIQGFSFTHMSGVGWYGDLGNLLVTPSVGPLQTWYGETGKPGSGYLSRFDKKSEVAKAGYYAVTLDDPGARVELTAAPRSGMLRFTFDGSHETGRIQMDLARRVGGTSLWQSVEVMNDKEIRGHIICTPEGGGWGHGAGKPNYTVYFHAEFDRPLTQVGGWSAELPEGKNYTDVIEKPWFIDACKNAKILLGTRNLEGKHIGFYAEFPTRQDRIVNLKVGLSFVSMDGARENLRSDIPDFDFDAIRNRARDAWEKELTRVTITGGTEDQRTAFYTSLYHALIDPRLLADANGDYPGGDGKVHATKHFSKRTIFSGWDVYRSAFPLYTLIAPRTVDDMINSMIELADQNRTKVFDRWEFLNAYSGCMNGNPAVVVINDAYRKNIRSYDVEKAYQYSVNTMNRWGNGERGYAVSRDFSLSETLEYANNDWNLSAFAAALGKANDAKKYAGRAQNYRKVFDPEAPWTYDEAGKQGNPAWKGWFRARGADGEFLPWRGLRTERTCQEASVYQQGWLVPYDVPGLMELLGGQELFLAKLNDFFDRTSNIKEWNPFYNHPNEPVHLIPFLFNRAGAPWLTQKWVRQIGKVYGTGPGGLCGDEDVGQMSAWFVLTAAGIHPACPGDPRYELFTPLFDRIELRLDPSYAKGKTFTVIAQNNSADNIYIQSATLDGKPLSRCWITHEEITAGGELTLVLGPQPNKSWGLADR